MNYQQAKAQRDVIEAEVTRAEVALKAFPRNGLMGLPTEEVRTLPEYQAARKEYATAFSRFQTFNQSFVKTFAKEIREERLRKRT